MRPLCVSTATCISVLVTVQAFVSAQKYLGSGSSGVRSRSFATSTKVDWN